MSSTLSPDAILYLQRTCASCGIYDGPIDGHWSKALDNAEATFESKSASLKADLGEFDPRSEKAIATLMIPAQEAARRFMKIASESGQTVRIISGTRTYAEQDMLYAIGRTIQMDRGPVTNARGGHSNHNFGIAWDVGLFATDGRYLTGATRGDDAAYAALASRVKAALPNIEWGGDWHTFSDAPHYQLAQGSVEETRAKFEQGLALV